MRRGSAVNDGGWRVAGGCGGLPARSATTSWTGPSSLSHRDQFGTLQQPTSEVGSELLERLIAADWAASTYARLGHLASDFCVALNRRDTPRLKYVAGRNVLHQGRW